MVAIGIVLGLLAALCQSLSYLGTRHFVGRAWRQHLPYGGSRQLLVLAHLIMGGLSLMILPWVWPTPFPPVGRFAWPLVLTSLFYLLGQIGLMVCLRYAEPSRISPMLAFKLVILAALSMVLQDARIAPLQWLAIVMCVGGGIVLNYAGGTNRPAALVALLGTCVAYSLSDWNIAYLVAAMGDMPRWQASLVSALLSYVLCGVVALPFLPALGSRRVRDWVDAAPFGVAWLLAMFFLFACFDAVGVVYGNILQSTRGLISVALGAILAGMGLMHLEKRAAGHVFMRRFVAAALMVSAVVLYRAHQTWLIASALIVAGGCIVAGLALWLWQQRRAEQMDQEDAMTMTGSPAGGNP